MDKWLGSGAKLLDSSKLQNLFEAPTDAPVVSEDGKKELRFGQGPLGFEIDCMHVASVTKDSQAARVGVEVGDRLLKVDGRSVPEYEPDDIEGERLAHDRVTKWLEDMPRPAFLTFESRQEPDNTLAASGAEDADVCPSPAISEGPAPSSGAVDPENDFIDSIHQFNSTAGPVASVLASDQQYPITQSDENQAGSAAAAEEIKRLQGLNSQLSEELKEQQRKFSSLWKQLATLKAENKQILSVQSRAQQESDEALETAEKREQALKEELAQTRLAADAANRAAAESSARMVDAAAEGAQQECAIKVTAAEKRAEAAESEVESLRRQLAGYDAEHETELRLLREKQEKWEQDAVERFDALELQHREKEAEW